MDFINLLMVFIGIIAVCTGMYEIAKKTVAGRNTAASTQEQIRKFSTIDGTTYIIEGTVVILMAFSDYIPFLGTAAGLYTAAGTLVACVIFNFVMAKRILNNFTKEDETDLRAGRNRLRNK